MQICIQSIKFYFLFRFKKLDDYNLKKKNFNYIIKEKKRNIFLPKTYHIKYFINSFLNIKSK